MNFNIKSVHIEERPEGIKIECVIRSGENDTISTQQTQKEFKDIGEALTFIAGWW